LRPSPLRPSPVTEQLAQQLHREYRAAEKALRCTDVAGERPYLQHDHGWEGCHKKQYFRQRASRLMVRADAINPTTLGDAEQALAATVLIRRLSVGGKFKVVANVRARISPRMTASPCSHCKHPQHPVGDCVERVVDAAGDVDWCPCSSEGK